MQLYTINTLNASYILSHEPPKPTCLMVSMVNNPVFTWPKPSFFMVLGAHGLYIYTILLYIPIYIRPEKSVYLHTTFRGAFASSGFVRASKLDFLQAKTTPAFTLSHLRVVGTPVVIFFPRGFPVEGDILSKSFRRKSETHNALKRFYTFVIYKKYFIVMSCIACLFVLGNVIS